MSYKKFNFLLFWKPAPDGVSGVLFNDAFALSNFRIMNFDFAKTNRGMILNFKPYRPANNPAVFSQALDINSPQAFAKDFPTNNPVVFFFFANDYNLFRAFNFFNHLRANYPGCKLVCWISNPIHYYQNAQKIFIDRATTVEFLSTFDCAFTYNPVDAMDYGLTYFEGPYSVLPFEQPELTTDIFYVGAAKNRVEKILRAYETFKAAGFVCDFYINHINNPPPRQIK